MKLTAINHYQVNLTLMTLRSLGQRSRSASDGDRYLVSMIDPVRISTKTYTNVYHICR